MVYLTDKTLTIEESIADTILIAIDENKNKISDYLITGLSKLGENSRRNVIEKLFKAKLNPKIRTKILLKTEFFLKPTEFKLVLDSLEPQDFKYCEFSCLVFNRVDSSLPDLLDFMSKNNGANGELITCFLTTISQSPGLCKTLVDNALLKFREAFKGKPISLTFTDENPDEIKSICELVKSCFINLKLTQKTRDHLLSLSWTYDDPEILEVAALSEDCEDRIIRNYRLMLKMVFNSYDIPRAAYSKIIKKIENSLLPTRVLKKLIINESSSSLVVYEENIRATKQKYTVIITHEVLSWLDKGKLLYLTMKHSSKNFNFSKLNMMMDNVPVKLSNDGYQQRLYRTKMLQLTKYIITSTQISNIERNDLLYKLVNNMHTPRSILRVFALATGRKSVILRESALSVLSKKKVRK